MIFPAQGKCVDLHRRLAGEIISGLLGREDEETANRGTPERRIDWALARRRYLWPDVQLDFEDHPYLRGIYEDEHPAIVVQKASQMGLSEWAITDAFWAADVKAANILYLLPQTLDVQDFSTTRIGLAIQASPYIAKIIEPLISAGGYKTRANDRLTLKRVRNRFFYIRHGSVGVDGRAPQLKVAAIDSIVFDELDEMDQRAPAIAEKRLGHSNLKWTRYISTPTLPDRGINRVMQQTDMREWQIRCDACRKWQALDPYKNLILETDSAGRPTEWRHKRGHPDWAYVGCAKCGKEIQRLGQGRWVATQREAYAHGYIINKLASARADLWEIIEKGKTLDETAMREWVNQDLGLPYQPRGGGFEGLVAASYRDYPQQDVGERCAMGVDVGAVLHAVIRRWGTEPIEGDENERVTRQAVFIGEVSTFDGLDALIRRYDVRLCVIDALPETRSVTALIRRFPGKVKMAYYMGGEAGLKRDEPFAEKAGQENVIELDRTRYFDALRAAYEGREIVNSRATESATPDYGRHYARLTRVVSTNNRGIAIATWHSTGPDHYAHADLYCMAALDLMGPIAVGDTAVMIEPEPKRDRKQERESAWWQ